MVYDMQNTCKKVFLYSNTKFFTQIEKEEKHFKSVHEFYTK